jgi:2'-5' RNA ligase
VDQLHLTVQFVGETPAREIDSVVESVERAAAGIGAFELRATGMVTLPRGTAARLVAAEFNAPPELMEIHRRLVSRLARRARDRQHFTPHMTLCRFKHGESVGEILVPLDGPQFSVRTIRLMRSVLRPAGGGAPAGGRGDVVRGSARSSPPGLGRRFTLIAAYQKLGVGAR